MSATSSTPLGFVHRFWRKTRRAGRVAVTLGSCVALLLLCPNPAIALQWMGPPPKLSWRVGRSEVIVLGRVGERTNVIPSRSDSIRIVPEVYSRYSFVVTEAWKGDVTAGDTITFARFGGQLPGGGWVEIGGDPQVSRGESLVLFLEHGSSGIWKREMTFSWFDGYVRIESRKGYGFHCPGKSMGWLRRRVRSVIERQR